MKILVEKITENPSGLMRRAGYVFQRESEGEESYVRVLARSGFPRFHCYARVKDGNLELSIHLDQKKETYGRDTRHHGEYEDDGPLKEEVSRLRSLFAGMTPVVE